jgi:hypothetical protein
MRLIFFSFYFLVKGLIEINCELIQILVLSTKKLVNLINTFVYFMQTLIIEWAKIVNNRKKLICEIKIFFFYNKSKLFDHSSTPSRAKILI